MCCRRKQQDGWELLVSESRVVHRLNFMISWRIIVCLLLVQVTEHYHPCNFKILTISQNTLFKKGITKASTLTRVTLFQPPTPPPTVDDICNPVTFTRSLYISERLI